MDFTTIETVLGLASSAVSVTGKATSTIEAIKKLVGSGKTADPTEVMKLLNALAVELTSANIMNVDLSGAVRTLNDELRKQDDFEKEKARYELIKTAQGAMVYRLRADKADGEPEHFICAACLKKDRLIVYIQGNGDFKSCQVNGAHVYQFEDTFYD